MPDEPVTNPGALSPEARALLTEIERNAIVAQVRLNTETIEDLRAALAPLVTLVGCGAEIVHTEVGIARFGMARIGTLLGLVGVLLALLGGLSIFGVDARQANDTALLWCEAVGACDHPRCEPVVSPAPAPPPEVAP